MRYRKFVFVVHIEFTIDMSIRNSRITIILSNYATIELCTNVVNINIFMVKSLIVLSHLLTAVFFLSFHVLNSSTQPKNVGKKIAVRYIILLLCMKKYYTTPRLPAVIACGYAHTSYLRFNSGFGALAVKDLIHGRYRWHDINEGPDKLMHVIIYRTL